MLHKEVQGLQNAETMHSMRFWKRTIKDSCSQ